MKREQAWLGMTGERIKDLDATRSRSATQRKKTYQEKAGRTWLGVAKDEWKNAVQGSA